MKKDFLKVKLIILLCIICLSDTIIYAQIDGQSTDNSIKYNLIRRLVNKRIQSDPILKQRYKDEDISKVESFPEIVLLGLPEGTIVTIVESYWIMKNNSSKSNKEILESIERHRKILFPESWNIPIPLTLSDYIKYRLKIEHSEGIPISDNYIDEAIEEANKVYR